MATQDKTYSVFISENPYGSSQLKFVYLCSEASVDYSLSYSGSATGVVGQGPDKTIFADGAAGAVGSISITGIRCNPATSQYAQWEHSDTFEDNISNAEFYRLMRSMLTKNQMFQGAYVLRIYDVDWSQVRDDREPYRELYIHITKCDMSIEWGNTSDAQISISAFRRNKTKGFGDA